jgi:hypothetical protein
MRFVCSNGALAHDSALSFGLVGWPCTHYYYVCVYDVICECMDLSIKHHKMNSVTFVSFKELSAGGPT